MHQATPINSAIPWSKLLCWWGRYTSSEKCGFQCANKGSRWIGSSSNTTLTLSIYIVFEHLQVRLAPIGALRGSLGWFTINSFGSALMWDWHLWLIEVLPRWRCVSIWQLNSCRVRHKVFRPGPFIEP